MTDEELYRQYLDGDDAGLTALMEKYGNALTLYIDGYLGIIENRAIAYSELSAIFCSMSLTSITHRECSTDCQLVTQHNIGEERGKRHQNGDASPK